MRVGVVVDCEPAWSSVTRSATELWYAVRMTVVVRNEAAVAGLRGWFTARERNAL